MKVYFFYIGIGLIIGWSSGRYGHKIEKNLVRRLLKHSWQKRKRIVAVGTDKEKREFVEMMDRSSLADYIYEHLMLDVLENFGDEFGSIKWDTPLQNLRSSRILYYIKNWQELN